ncbi:MAG: biopolymer transporter Tol, partial [Calditrichota bacterium]
MMVLLGGNLTNSIAQISSYNHPELKWQTIESEHFAVHFYPGTERSARIILTIADQVYTPVTNLYDYRPEGKVHWIVRDHDDYSNGATYYYENKIEIWAKPLDFEFRSTHHWLYDVVTHEFTHMIQLGASRKAPRWLPAVYFQYINYEREKRPDVLYGFPNRLISWPVAMTVVPMWFAEGTAQFQEESLHHDWWDAHRDMMIRVRALSGRLLTKNEMEVFGKTSLGS